MSGLVGWLVWLVADKNAEEGVQDEQDPVPQGTAVVVSECSCLI